ncbi:MAG: glycosyltransferase [Rhodoblastus sp.]|nr:glycosyltransferase [Rhodoblastus sp.]
MRDVVATRPVAPKSYPEEARRSAALEARALAEIGLPALSIAHAAAQARWTGASLGATVLADRTIDEDALYRALAARLGVPFVTQPVRLDARADYGAAAAAGVAALARPIGDVRWLAAPRGRAMAALLALPNAAGLAITTPRRLGAWLRASVGAEIAEDAALRLHRIEPRLSARAGPSRAARWLGVAVLAACAALAVLWPQILAALAWTLLTIAFSAATVTRLFMAAAAFRPEPESPPLADRDLPVYTIVVALYREADVARALIDALEALAYPRAKLDIKFVVEAEDTATFAALAAALPGVEYEIVVAPPGAPRTKPRALNIALPFAHGELLCIYDAEDRPDPDQLRRAAARFAAAGKSLGCLQARLAADNADENVIAGLFAIDYAALFEVANPGAASLRLPMMLGGTSNHFRTQTLRDLCGWDAWNVTEDADLGIRLARCGLRVETLASRTHEEAPITASALLNQRVRWMKGWMQTAFVHLRDPVALWLNLRPLAFFTTLAFFVSGVLSPLLWPYFSIVLARDLVTGSLFAPATIIDHVVDTCALWLAIAGPIAMIWPAALGMKRQGLRHRWPLLFLLPLWHVMLSIAAWRAIYDLWRNPFGWAKTTHGVAQRRMPPAADQRQSMKDFSSAPIARATASPSNDRTTTPARS